MEGFRLRRDVEFARDGSRVLAMDIMYPANPKHSVPTLMEITCDNKDRMGSFSLLFCHDTVLEGAQAAGFAVAMIDHPVAPPYKGIDDPMPQCIERCKAAVRVLRSLGPELKLNGKIGAIGFSRGGPMAALLAVTSTNNDPTTAIQAALIHGNRYDYSDVSPDDPMYARFEKAWGPRDANALRWAEHGAAHYLTQDAAPMFLNTSDSESKEFRAGLEQFAKLLNEKGIDHVYQQDADGRGHQVTTDPKTLMRIYQFFSEHLSSR
jgi:acetyl esterase/lipase